MQSELIDPTKKDLRNFGLIMGGMLPLIFGLLIPWIWDFNMPSWPWIASLIFVSLALALPQALKVVYKYWLKFAHVLGWVNTHIILTIVFYFIIMPTGFVMKLFRKDVMKRKYDRQCQSYRTISKQPSTDNLERPF